MVIILGVGAYFLLHNDISGVTGQTVSTTKKSSTQPGVSINTSTSSQDAKPTTTNGNAPTTTDVSAPSGSFVSNHHPSLSAPANTMNSVCRTNVGITCQINFTKGSELKTLGPDTVGSDGTISWEWKLQDIGLSAGTWQIQAVAKSASQTVTTNDPLALEVNP